MNATDENDMGYGLGGNQIGLSEASFSYPGWRVVFLASAGMVATLSGRTVGLGLITEPLLSDLQMTRVHYANLTLWATIIGAAFSPFCGKAIDQWGVRNALSCVIFLLAVTTITMSRFLATGNLLLFLILSRGFGQSSLSTASVTAVGKWFTFRLGIALGVFSALVALGFATSIPVLSVFITTQDWRNAWFGVGGLLLVLSVSTLVLIPDATKKPEEQRKPDEASLSWASAMGTLVFWTFTVSTALYYLVLSGLTLFCESILSELGFDRSAYIAGMVSMMGAGLLGNFLAGWLCVRWSVTRLLAISLVALVIVLFGLPLLRSIESVVLLFALYGVCGGAFAVLFFAGYGQAFGQSHLGRIQGTAQAIGVVASAIGPKLLAETEAATGSYLPAFWWFGVVAAVLALVAWLTPMPNRIDVPK